MSLDWLLTVPDLGYAFGPAGIVPNPCPGSGIDNCQ
jgi:ribosomal protein L1